MLTLKRLWLIQDVKDHNQWSEFLQAGGLHPAEDATYTVGIYDGEELIATGSLSDNIIKYLLVCKRYQSENLLTQIIVHLIERLHEEDIFHYFVYTAPDKEVIFRSLGFKKIMNTKEVLFMEQGEPSFDDYLNYIARFDHPGENGSIVMNANPFTLGHKYLVEQARKVCDHVYVFVVSEEKSEFSSPERFALVKNGLKEFEDVTVLPARDYMVSSLTFPAYFLKDRAELNVASVQARLDATLFKERIAPVLHIKKRFVGEEPYSKVTNVYNEAMKEVFRPDLSLTILPRLAIEGEIVSATKVRQALQDHNEPLVQSFVPDTVLAYLKEKNKI
ncbi:[citrate (pro-3S)-lyase] ligase [Enterococcus sp. MJM12]|uniref:[Citrate [pro-3S]-lyase] ligase n=1 Tax=Candidatus Enterococcus myersii TaxID=2815322 RepID=A0ABS3H8E9_9ENTE|nr:MULTISPECIES: [citrate (pro-3S)-lyase] ligase [Enterococcus]MBO0449279.1 [citrate (pro-3S)-lyase] ligase [Enterococcus sp. MJM12]MCD1025251.1 [citrate (pro-3S)-lyase] ligase [Enterococcus sp. SMC-9]WHA09575.1 [citrate (pro-3S)-lyase] ligase [Enterococcus montenegrensis]